jgi:phospholipase/carboxylesterase
VQTATDTELINFNGWTLRVHPSQSSNPRLLVMIHGWTGDENSMWVFTRGLSPDYWIVAPRAPHTAEPSGYSWRPLQPGTWGMPSLEQLYPAAEGLICLMDEYTASVKFEALTFDVMGFSQGGAMVNVLGMLFPQRIQKMGVLAGFVPAGLDEHIAKKALAGKNVFVAHGTKDEMVTVERARASMGLLEQAGADITYCEDEVGHKLSKDCLRALEVYLSSPSGRG